MSKEMDFFIFLLERYAEKKNATAPEVLKLWDEAKFGENMTVTEYVLERYYIYHQEAIENAFMDIDHVLATGEMLY